MGIRGLLSPLLIACVDESMEFYAFVVFVADICVRKLIETGRCTTQ